MRCPTYSSYQSVMTTVMITNDKDKDVMTSSLKLFYRVNILVRIISIYLINNDKNYKQ